MSVYKPRDGKSFVYDFWLFGQHYKKSTGQTDRALAEKMEADLKADLRRQLAGRASPKFTDWADIYYRYVVREQQLRRPEAVDDVLRVVLRFCGAKPSGTNPKNPIVAGEPYHDLCLDDFVQDADWILRFEEWMDARGISRMTKHHYRTYLSRMYKVAALPQYRKLTGIQPDVNPFRGIPRGQKTVRRVTLNVAGVLKALGAMSYHVRLALSIAALAPTLRLANVLALRFDEHLDDAMRWIRVDEHKTVGRTGAPKVAPVPAQLRTILLDAKQRRSLKCQFVVQYRGKPVKTITNGVRAGFERAGIPYGRFAPNGATFHTIRHSISTLMPQLGVNPWHHQGLMGWSDVATAMTYTHLQPEHLVGAAEQLSAALPIADIVTAPRRRAAGLSQDRDNGPMGRSVGPARATSAKASINLRLAGRHPGRPFARKAQ